MNSFDLRTPDLYTDTINRLQVCRDSSISIPELSRLLGVKSTTLNARLRRQRIAVRTVGRTNFVPGDLALKLAELHKHALIGWPTLRQASQICGIKPGTIKARCEKGQLESCVDLTKRLRINPADLDGLHLHSHRAGVTGTPDHALEPGLPTSAQKPSNGSEDHSETVYLHAAENQKVPCSSPRQETPDRPRGMEAVGPSASPLPASHQNGPKNGNSTAHTPLRAALAAHEITVVFQSGHALPEVEKPGTIRLSQAKQPQMECKKPGLLIYDPDEPFCITACAIGSSVRYEEYDGRIVGIIDDPFSPKIKVRFPEHQHPLMREVLLTVGKRRVAR